jgi:hypothetical protein
VVSFLAHPGIGIPSSTLFDTDRSSVNPHLVHRDPSQFSSPDIFTTPQPSDMDVIRILPSFTSRYMGPPLTVAFLDHDRVVAINACHNYSRVQILFEQASQQNVDSVLECNLILANTWR